MKKIFEIIVKDSRITFSSGRVRFSASGALAVLVFGGVMTLAILYGGLGEWGSSD